MGGLRPFSWPAQGLLDLPVDGRASTGDWSPACGPPERGGTPASSGRNDDALALPPFPSRIVGVGCSPRRATSRVSRTRGSETRSPARHWTGMRIRATTEGAPTSRASTSGWVMYTGKTLGRATKQGTMLRLWRQLPPPQSCAAGGDCTPESPRCNKIPEEKVPHCRSTWRPPKSRLSLQLHPEHAVDEVPVVLGRNSDPTGTPRQETLHPAPLSGAQLVTLHLHSSTKLHSPSYTLPQFHSTSLPPVPSLLPHSGFVQLSIRPNMSKCFESI